MLNVGFHMRKNTDDDISCECVEFKERPRTEKKLDTKWCDTVLELLVQCFGMDRACC